jgi:hypothetical protein
MAAGWLSPPGTQYGPCEGTCHHSDCAEWRLMAASVCRLCEKNIGYDTRFYKDPETRDKPMALRRYVHAFCVEHAIRQERTHHGEEER